MEAPTGREFPRVGSGQALRAPCRSGEGRGFEQPNTERRSSPWMRTWGCSPRPPWALDHDAAEPEGRGVGAPSRHHGTAAAGGGASPPGPSDQQRRHVGQKLHFRVSSDRETGDLGPGPVNPVTSGWISLRSLLGALSMAPAWAVGCGLWRGRPFLCELVEFTALKLPLGCPFP